MLGDQVLDSVSIERDLGVLIQDNLKVSAQCTRTVTGRTFQVQAGFGFLPQKSGGFTENPPDNYFWAGGWAEYLSEY